MNKPYLKAWRGLPLVQLALLALLTAPGLACQSSYPARNPIGEAFPQVTGRSLAGEEVELPPLGRPSVLLIGYAQDAQFDADRWLQGLLQAQLDARILELPTIPGLLARAAGGFIDAGMRSGIPSEDWASVVTVYGAEAEPIARFTGSERSRNMRVLALDAEGRVRWMHDRGYSASMLLELAEVVRSLPRPRNDPTPMLAAPDARADLELLRAALETVHAGTYRYATRPELDAAFAGLDEQLTRDGGTTIGAFYRDVSLLCARLRCGHTRVETPASLEEYRNSHPTHLPFAFRLLEGRMIVTAVDEVASELEVGAEVLALDDRSVADIVRSIAPAMILDGWTDAARPSRLDTPYEFQDSGLEHYLPLFEGFRDSFTLTVRSHTGGAARRLRVPAVLPERSQALRPASASEFAHAVSLRELVPGTALLSIGTFVNYREPVDPEDIYGPIFHDLNERGIEHLVIDLRSCGGGSSDAAWGLARFIAPAAFTPALRAPRVKNIRFGELVPHLSTWVEGAFEMPEQSFRRSEDGWYEVLAEQPRQIEPHPDRYTGRVTVLVGPLVASGTTMLLAVLREQASLQLVGEPTAGSAEGPTAGLLFFLKLPRSGIQVDLPVFAQRTSAMCFEPGMGVAPDLHINQSIADLLAGRDSALEAALR